MSRQQLSIPRVSLFKCLLPASVRDGDAAN